MQSAWKARSHSTQARQAPAGTHLPDCVLEIQAYHCAGYNQHLETENYCILSHTIEQNINTQGVLLYMSC